MRYFTNFTHIHFVVVVSTLLYFFFAFSVNYIFNNDNNNSKSFQNDHFKILTLIAATLIFLDYFFLL